MTRPQPGGQGHSETRVFRVSSVDSVADDLDVEDGEQLVLQVRGQVGQASGHLGQQADEVGVRGRGVVGGQFGELGFKGFAFVVQGGVVGPGAAAVLFADFIRHVERAGQPTHQVVLPDGDPLEPLR
jgi:hypothetical protein